MFQVTKRPFRNSVDTITPRTLPTHPPNIAISERSDSLTHSPPIDVKLSASARRRSLSSAERVRIRELGRVEHPYAPLFTSTHLSTKPPKATYPPTNPQVNSAIRHVRSPS